MSAGEGGGIFVSYRRQESSHLAGRLSDRLADRFGEDQVFIDVDAIGPGVDFTEEISRAVAACKVLLAVIGPNWLAATDERGLRRLDDPDDIVRLEIQSALERDILVIPILIEGAVMPRRRDLPGGLAGLARRNALPIRHESFHYDAERLVTAIEQVLTMATETTAVPNSLDVHGARLTSKSISEVAQRVFLSYRRSDSWHQAIALKVVLEQKLPDVTVFVDTESVNPSERWPDRLTAALDHSSAVVTLIGPNWRFGADGTDRFADPKDWVLQELEHALEHKDAIVPVFFDTTTTTAYRDLPPSLTGLRHIQGLKLSSETWLQDVDLLASSVAKILGTKASERTFQFPNPSELKKLARHVTEAEFDKHRRDVDGLAKWVFSRVLINTPDGEVEGTQISRSFTFTNFKRAFTFMARSAELAESRPHHPDWTNVWNRVDVRLRTFDASQSVTWYDIEMAFDMHQIALQVANEDKIGWPLRPSLRRKVQTKPR